MDDYVFYAPRFKVENVISTLSAEDIIDWGLSSLNIPQCWLTTRGENIKVGVLDTGVAGNHPDLCESIGKVKDFTNSCYGASDNIGHGTHVCGIISARENLTGVIGVAPKTKIYIAKIIGDNQAGSIENVCNALKWCLDCHVDIISMSIGTSSPNENLQQNIKEAIDKNVFIISAAGNDGNNMLDTINYPAKYENVISVGSINKKMLRSSFSSVGKRLDILAPGEEIYSTYPPNTYAILKGTSMACPFVTGVAALIISKHRLTTESSTPCITQNDLRDHLLKVAIDINTPGWDSTTGFGIVNPLESVKA